jgi:Phage integrase SAM-like domain
MHQPIKFIIKAGKSRKDGTSLIFLQYCYSSTKRILLGTDIGIPAYYWNRKTKSILRTLPKEYGDPEILEIDLRDKLRRAEKLIDYALVQKNTCPLKFLKKNFRTAGDKYLEQVGYDRGKLCLFNQIDCYIRDKRDIVQETTLTTIRCMKKHLYGYQSYHQSLITFDSFDIGFHERFVKYLTYEVIMLRRNKIIRGLKVNTIGKTIKHLKCFLKDRMARKIIPFIDLGFFKYLEEQVDAVYLSWDELSKIYHLDLSANPCLVKYRDIFILGCLTGFRFSDYSNIQFNDLRDGMLHITQKKTLSTVIVPLREEGRRILINKYEMQIPRVSMVNFNYYIKEVVAWQGSLNP